MAILKQIGIVLLGYVVMAVVVMVLGYGFLLITGMPREGEPTVLHYLANVIFTALAAFAGAMVVVKLARPHPLPPLAGLAGLMIVMTIVTLFVGTGPVQAPVAWTVIELAIGLAVVALVAARAKSTDDPRAPARRAR